MESEGWLNQNQKSRLLVLLFWKGKKEEGSITGWIKKIKWWIL
jgi:hypothetical protein